MPMTYVLAPHAGVGVVGDSRDYRSAYGLWPGMGAE
jgi:hypothetical protein